MRLPITLALLPLLVLSGCGGGSSQSGIPAAASKMDQELKSKMTRFVPLVANTETSLIFVLNPGMAPNVEFSPYTGIGVPMAFGGTYDKNGDGFSETKISNGQVTFNSNPYDLSDDWGGMSGQATIEVSIPLLGHVYQSTLAFAFLPDQRQISGTGTFTEPITGNHTTMTIPDTSPLVIKAADGGAGAISNACGYSLNGQIRLDVTGSDGTLTSYWNFNPSSPSIAVNGTSFTDNSGNATALPDSSVNLTCTNGGSINDWVGTFQQNWACLPRESGSATLTLAAGGADTVSITDVDSGNTKQYEAALLGANTHAVRGSFVGGIVGNHYLERFNWTLSKSGNSFSQISFYRYTEGPNTGKGGICVATARRQ